MKHSIRLTGPNGAHAYLSHRGKSSFAPATARKYLAQWLAANPGGIARIEDQFRDPVTSRTLRRETSPILGDVLRINGVAVACIHGDTVSPMHGYYPRHPYATRVKRWAVKRGFLTPLY